MSDEPIARVLVTHRFRAAPERVFDAWLAPASISQWMSSPGPGEIVRVEVDARVGGRFSFVVRRAGQDIEHTGQYLVLERPRRLAFSWGVPSFSPEFTTVRIEFVAVGSGTEVTLLHERVPPEYVEPNRNGWTTILARIAAELDRDTP
jgi:uncharacterized protein YndB with AHSA1/START domain